MGQTRVPAVADKEMEIQAGVRSTTPLRGDGAGGHQGAFAGDSKRARNARNRRAACAAECPWPDLDDDATCVAGARWIAERSFWPYQGITLTHGRPVPRGLGAVTMCSSTNSMEPPCGSWVNTTQIWRVGLVPGRAGAPGVAAPKQAPSSAPGGPWLSTMTPACSPPAWCAAVYSYASANTGDPTYEAPDSGGIVVHALAGARPAQGACDTVEATRKARLKALWRLSLCLADKTGGVPFQLIRTIGDCALWDVQTVGTAESGDAGRLLQLIGRALGETRAAATAPDVRAVPLTAREQTRTARGFLGTAEALMEVAATRRGMTDPSSDGMMLQLARFITPFATEVATPGLPDTTLLSIG
jgi:hypothetical protein